MSQICWYHYQHFRCCARQKQIFSGRDFLVWVQCFNNASFDTCSAICSNAICFPAVLFVRAINFQTSISWMATSCYELKDRVRRSFGKRHIQPLLSLAKIKENMTKKKENNSPRVQSSLPNGFQSFVGYCSSKHNHCCSASNDRD